MDLGESFEEVAIREVKEETGLVIHNLKLLDVYAGSNYYLKVSNGDELYSATAVYYTKQVSGIMSIDYNESKDIKFLKINELPDTLTGTDRGFIEDYLEKLSC